MNEAAKPTDELLEPLVVAFRKSDYDVGGLVQTILRSRLFFSEHAYRQRIKSPVELVLRGAKSRVARSHPNLTSWLQEMGQPLFAPNVKAGRRRSWLNTATLLARDNFAYAVTLGNLSSVSSIGQLLEMEKCQQPEDLVRVLADVCFQGNLPPQKRARIVASVAAGAASRKELEQRARTVAHDLMTMPEYQLA